MTAIWRTLALLACAVMALPSRALAQDDSLALRIKATYLYKFAPFIEWPASLEISDTFDICVIGDDPFGRTLDEAVSGQIIQEAPIRVRRFPAVSGDAGGCRIMYLAGSEAQSIAEALMATRGLPVLTVTDEARDPRSEGVVHFVQARGKIKFRIDNLLAEENNLVVGSQLLDLAVSVRASRSDAGPVRVR